MFKRLRIQNFKGWKDTGHIRMAPLSLFFGANSSGKSSIGQFLMMLKQTVESQDRKAVFYSGGINTAVQLGSFQEMVYQRDAETKIKFEYEWSIPEMLRFKDPLSDQGFSGDKLIFDAQAGLGDANQHALMLDHLKYELIQGSDTRLTVGMERKPNTKSEYRVNAKHYRLTRKPGRGWSPGTPVRFYGFPDEVVAYYQNADFVQTLNLQQEQLFRSICYLGPLRTKPERLYTWSGVQPESVGYAGEHTIAAILSARNRKIGLGYKKRLKSFEKIIALKLKEMGLIERFNVNPISDKRQDYEVKICTKGSNDWVDLPDVGFGISQVLPVLVQCFYAPVGSIILMEQPEIHLHPNAQSALADVMIDVIRSRENGKDRNIQLVIETHSEHFLRRLQRRIAEDKVSDGKVSAYFANIGKTPATLDPLQLDLFGNILNWPENFFGAEMDDITEHALAVMKKRMRNADNAEVSH